MTDEKFAEILKRHPLPWRVTDAYKQWNASDSHGSSPPAIVDADYVEGDKGDKPNVIVSSSEWLLMETDIAEMIVAMVNGGQREDR